MSFDLRKDSWKVWTPSSVKKGDKPFHWMTLQQVFDHMPRIEAEKIPEIVRKYENPESEYALPGAISLFRHDIIHILLDRGLLPADEAFIIGVTMASDHEFKDEHAEKFAKIATEEYPEPYNFTKNELNSYFLGVGYGLEHLNGVNLHKIPFEDMMNERIFDVRYELGINVPELNAYSRIEKLMGDCIATRRL